MYNLELWLLLFLYLVTSAIYVLDLLRTYKKANSLTMAFYCKAMYLLIEAIVPLIMIGGYTFSGKTFSDVFTIDFSVDGVFALFLLWLLSVFGYIALELGINGKFRITLGSRKQAHRGVSIESTADDLPILITTWICLIIGIVSMHLWSRAYGGIGAAIENANAIRAGYFTGDNSMAFFKHPARMVLVASYAFFTICRCRKINILNILALVVSAAYSVMFLLASDGRLSAGFYFLTLGVIYIRTFRATSRKKRNRNIALIAVLGIAVVIFMLKMDTITQFLRTGQWVEESDSKSFIDALMGELSFVMHSGQYVIMHSSQIPLQIGNDIGYGLFAWVPTSLTPASLERLWTINTELLGSLRHGEIPCDMITQGYYDLKVFGVFLIPFVFGRLIKKVDERSFNTLLGNIVFAALFSVMIRAIPYGMVYDFVLGLFGLAVYYVVYKVIKLIPAKK